MKAELAAVEGHSGRRRYALGCVRAVVMTPPALRRVGSVALAGSAGSVVLVLAVGIKTANLRADMVGLVVVVFACLVRRRGGLLGPVGQSRTARRARAGGYAVVSAALVYFVVDFRFPVGDRSPGANATWGLIAALSVTSYLLTFMVLTSSSAGAERRTLQVGEVATFAGSAAWLLMTMVSSSTRAHPQWALGVVAVTTLSSLVVTTSRSVSATQVLLAGIGTATATCLVVFVASVITYRVAPQMTPPLGRPGLTIAHQNVQQQMVQQRTESTDPFVAELVLGGLLGSATLFATFLGRSRRFDAVARLGPRQA